MEPNNNRHILLIIISTITFMLLNSAQSICVQRKSITLDHGSTSSKPVSALESAESPSSNAHVSSPISSPPTPLISAPPPSHHEDIPISHISAPTPSTEGSSDPPTSSLKQMTDAPKETFETRIQDLHPSSPSTINNLALKKICDKTDFSSLCFSSISPFFDGKTETTSVLEMSIKAAMEQTKQAISGATKMATSSNPSRASNLQDCKENYNDALDNLQSAMDAIASGDIGTVNSMLSAVVTDFGTCDDLFAGDNPLAGYDAKLTDMASNCLAISSLMK